MRVRTLLALAFAVLIAACSPVTLQDRVENTPQEILYTDVLSEGLTSLQISYFGVRFGATEEQVREIHGEPLLEQEYRFGREKIVEYAFGSTNHTTVLYHFEQGFLTNVLVTDAAAEVLAYDSLLGGDRADVYSSLGIPTLAEDLHLERVFAYDDFGYEVYFVKGKVDRIYFTQPYRGLQPVGNETVPSYEIPDVEIEEIIEEERVEKEENAPPVFCIQVIQPAINPDSGVCQEFSTPCDVPSGWEPVATC